MTYPKAIVIAAAFIASAIAFSAIQPAQSASTDGQYRFFPTDNLGIIIVGNQATGQTWACTISKEAACDPYARP